MPKVKALHSIGVGHLLGSHSIDHVGGIIPNKKVLELSEELINLIGAESFESVATEETKMSEEVQTPVTPETPVVQPEQTPVQESETLPVESTEPVTPETPAV